MAPLAWSDNDAWSVIRATRSDPPGPTANGPDRLNTYVAALEQSEQLFRAAAQIGIASRPLPLFYGLSQAGRAVAAAANSLPANGWKLNGHGITAVNLHGEFRQIAVHSARGTNTSFVKLSRVLDSPQLDEKSPAPLDEIWETLPELLRWPIRDPTLQRPALNVWAPQADAPHELATAAVMNIPGWLITAEHPRAQFDEFMQAYPTATGYTMVRKSAEPDAPPDLHGGPDGHAELQMHWEVPGQPGLKSRTDREAYLDEKVLTSYRTGQYLLPAVGATSRPLHPMLAWWAVLYTLSMLARYEPSQWASDIDVNSSRYAVPIERLLTEALSAVPDVIAQTIRQVQG